MYGEIALLDTTSFVKTRLVRHGYLYLSDMLQANISQIAKDTKISEVQIHDLIKQAMVYSNQISSCPAHQEIINEKIITLCKGIDTVLSNGFRIGGVHEIAGLSGTGKTQLAMQICLTVQIPKEFGGQAGSCLFIDTDGTFSKSRMRQITEGYVDYFMKDCGIEISKAKIFENIGFARVTSEQQYLLLLDKIERYIKPDCKLIVIDSFGFLLKDMQRVDAVQKSKFLTKLGLKFQALSCNRKLAIVLTNKLTYNENEGCKPQFGESWSSVLSSRLLLGVEDNHRYVTMIKGGTSQELLQFKICTNGLFDNE